MASFTDTFERKEVKYRLNAKQHREVLEALEGRMAADEYGRSRITSLYFDTPTRDLIARSLEKPLYKEKLRMRWYAAPAPGERAYVEIKKKYDGIVYKRRVGCSLAAAHAYLMGRMPYENACVQHPLADQAQQEEALALRSIQIAREIDAFVARYRNLRPSMYIVCERTAYAPVPGGEADGLRITFDSGVAYRDVLAGQGAADGAFHPLLGLGEVIMEVKTAGSFPAWLVEALNGCQAYPSSFSKYGAAYQECERVAAVTQRTRETGRPSQAKGGWRGHSPAADAARAALGRDRAPQQALTATFSQVAGLQQRANPQGAARRVSQETAAIDRLAPARDSRTRCVAAPVRGLRRPCLGRLRASLKHSSTPVSRKENRCA